ncbi:hypothetical protein SXCC_02238 [Gluconacetobacter sp. SXCC-1]|nr:hypothetical protein SXCC_02238 [Gluconacetobacter sp. SXCC-1]
MDLVTPQRLPIPKLGVPLAGGTLFLCPACNTPMGKGIGRQPEQTYPALPWGGPA